LSVADRPLSIAAFAGALLTACTPLASEPSSAFVNLSEYKVSPRVAEVAAGEVTFTARNAGPRDRHELVIVRTDVSADALPTVAEGGMDEDGAGVEVIGEIEELAVGKQESATFRLPAGRYVLLCNMVEEDDGEVEAHYAKGMYTTFTVR